MQQPRRMHPREAVSERRPVARAPARSASPSGRLLGNGRLRTLFTAAGTGGSWLGSDALYRWRGDRVEDLDGWFHYLRDLKSGAFWSAGIRPVALPLDHYEVANAPGSISITRETHGIESRLDVWVDAEQPMECRHLTLRNRSAHTRRIEVTSVLEVVLHRPQADAAHPAFSKLFIETEAIPSRGTVLARRRPRDPRGAHPWLAQSLGGRGALELATDRSSFVGRGRDLVRPVALTERAPLLATTGAVLDPILALRARCRWPRARAPSCRCCSPRPRAASRRWRAFWA